MEHRPSLLCTISLPPDEPLRLGRVDGLRLRAALRARARSGAAAGVLAETHLPRMKLRPSGIALDAPPARLLGLLRAGVSVPGAARPARTRGPGWCLGNACRRGKELGRDGQAHQLERGIGLENSVCPGCPRGDATPHPWDAPRFSRRSVDGHANGRICASVDALNLSRT